MISPESNPLVRRAVRLSMMASATAAAAVAMPAAAQAQDQAGTDTDDIDTVVVTGSRIRRVDAETASPVISISADDIARSGLTTMGDVLQRLPTVAGSARWCWSMAGASAFTAIPRLRRSTSTCCRST
jgi:outer membrane receptor protein involved in Fe transport